VTTSVGEIRGVRLAQGRTLAVARLARVPATPLAVALAVVGLSFNSGTYDLLSRNPVAIAVWWAVVLAVGALVLPLERLPRSAWVAGGALAAYAALTAASIAWAPSAESAFDELNRVTLYLGVFTLVALASRRGSSARWSDGIALGTAAIALLALAVRLFPHLIPGANHSPLFPGDPRPNYPLGYWNALAVMLALGVAPLLRVAAAGRSRLARAAAVAALPALAAVIDLTLSRGGAIAAAVAAALFVALTASRLRALAAVAAGALGSAVAVAALAARPAISSGPLDSARAAAQGRSAALLVLAGCLAAAAALLVLERVVPRADPPLPRRLKLALAVLALAAVAGALAGSHPAHMLAQFKQPPAPGKQLLTSQGNGRWQMWQAAVHELRAHPAGGGGAGSYAEWWAAHAPFPYFTRYAHSLYLQSLAELGAAGVALLLALLLAAALALARRLRAAPAAERSAVAAIGAVVFAFALAAAVDWMWELTVVGVIGVGALAVLTGPAALPAAASSRRARLSAGRLAVVVAGAVLIAAQAIPYVAGTLVGDSQAAFRRGDVATAAARATEARDVQPWAASTWSQLALVRERQRRLHDAGVAIRRALARDGGDWRLWLIAARIEAEAGHAAPARALGDRARSLNPQSPVWRAAAPR
jgi:hypothetical protein